jgi:glutamine amidotransferase
MCRLFGFRSVIPSKVHRSLLAAENALGVQSNDHPDGWGVAFYVDGTPHVTRSPLTALGDSLFHKLSGVVASQTVLAHVRKATQGPKTVLNCHPFQYGRWVFAHNGDIPRLDDRRDELMHEISPELVCSCRCSRRTGHSGNASSSGRSRRLCGARWNACAPSAMEGTPSRRCSR